MDLPVQFKPGDEAYVLHNTLIYGCEIKSASILLEKSSVKVEYDLIISDKHTLPMEDNLLENIPDRLVFPSVELLLECLMINVVE